MIDETICWAAIRAARALMTRSNMHPEAAEADQRAAVAMLRLAESYFSGDDEAATIKALGNP